MIKFNCDYLQNKRYTAITLAFPKAGRKWRTHLVQEFLYCTWISRRDDPSFSCGFRSAVILK